ncbi:TetR/AcrR family transcriptional regulator [Micromonospora sp. NBC_01796]|uniref:TetR/AcrR family transcriptional regulator n=1 Tax=Micromonospora sp. NBC_01796 TaxID=2975987 RepID=UPI002DD80385|nr:TetR family transcriptional regulator [Micromonospora sp. NBC_01796]WSA83150.1 TetR family transcriptional regulator [Micromonospora sp. NBC_01796]
MSSRQDQLTDAAIRVLGGQGLRQLTHRAVDAEAGLPAGSASNHFRTRDALLTGVVARLAALDRADWQGMTGAVHPSDLDELARLLADFVRTAVGAGRLRTVARLALCLDAAVRPQLQADLGQGNAELVRWGAPWLRAVGSPDPERHCRLMLDHMDGVIMHQLAFPDPDFDPTPGLRLLLGAIAPPAVTHT